MTTKDKINIMLEAPMTTSVYAYRTFLKDMLEECELYRWHDLRENPADLPHEMEPGDDFSVEVLLAIRFDEDEPGSDYTYTVGYVNVINDDTFEWWACTDSSSHRIIKPSHVVKWRYID